jgi:hypothetical protein
MVCLPRLCGYSFVIALDQVIPLAYESGILNNERQLEPEGEWHYHQQD